MGLSTGSWLTLSARPGAGQSRVNSGRHQWLYIYTEAGRTQVGSHAAWPPDALLPAQVIRDKSSQQSRGFAFVTFTHAAYASFAMTHMNNKELYGPLFGGRALRVGPSNRANQA